MHTTLGFGCVFTVLFWWIWSSSACLRKDILEASTLGPYISESHLLSPPICVVIYSEYKIFVKILFF